MKFGTLDMKNCGDCPAYKHNGFGSQGHDRGVRCGFGAYNGLDTPDEPKQIPTNCPIRVLRNLAKVVNK